MELYCYVIACDAGHAPNYDPPFTTLAICKPRIRKGAKERKGTEEGDAVLAFTGVKLSLEPHAVRWAGVVKEKLTFTEYWNDRRFAGKKPDATERPDNIYKPRGNGRSFEQIKNKSHGPKHTLSDLRGCYVLVLDPVWRFQGSAPILPARFGYRMGLTARRSHRRHELTPDAWRRLRTWLTDRQKEIGIASPRGGTKTCEPPRVRREMGRPAGKQRTRCG